MSFESVVALRFQVVAHLHKHQVHARGCASYDSGIRQE